jgi:hypothetical protein
MKNRKKSIWQGFHCYVVSFLLLNVILMDSKLQEKVDSLYVVVFFIWERMEVFVFFLAIEMSLLLNNIDM